MTQDQHKLEPCPFCGGEASFGRTGTHRRSCIVTCSECGATLESSDEYERSGAAWNRRAHLQQRPLPVREQPTPDERWTIERAADFLEGYILYIRAHVTTTDIECHPYLPELEYVAGQVRTWFASPSVQNMGEGETGKDGVNPSDGSQA